MVYMFQTNLLYYKSVFSKSIYIKTPKLRKFFPYSFVKKAFRPYSFDPPAFSGYMFRLIFAFLPFFPYFTLYIPHHS